MKQILESFSDLVGQTLTDVRVDKAADEIVFELADGSCYKLLHIQDCCESVTIEDVNGDPRDLVGSSILFAEESSNKDECSDSAVEPNDSFTWTFYRIGTIKGTVVIRWFGTSNGWYSESVDWFPA